MTKEKFSVWAVQWLELVKPTVKGNTFTASYKIPVEKHLIPFFGKKILDEIRQSEIQTYINMIAPKYVKDTVNKHKFCLFQIFETAFENDYCIKNPVKKIKIPKTKERAEKSVYTNEQAELVFQYGYRHRFGAEIQFLLATAVSRSELLGLRWCDIDLINRAVNIRHGVVIIPGEVKKQETFVGDLKNRYRKRDMPISEELCKILYKLPHRSDFVFCNKYGEVHNPNTWSKTHFAVFMRDMREYYQELSIDVPVVNPHQLRHTRLSLWINSGKSPIATAKAAGHVNLDMLLKRYVHSSVEEIRELLDIN